MKTKNLFNALMAVLVIVGLSACDNLKKDKEETDPEKTIGKVGNYWKGYADGYPNSTITIEENNDGNVVASFPFNGKTIEVEGKITDNGFSDYVYSNGDKTKPFVLVKFDAKVGDKWEYKIGNQTITREVVKKSTTDDTPYGFWNIKTIDVLETIPAGVQVRGATSPVKTILYKWNHKFGFVFAEIVKTDNTKVEVTSITNAAD